MASNAPDNINSSDQLTPPKKNLRKKSVSFVPRDDIIESSIPPQVAELVPEPTSSVDGTISLPNNLGAPTESPKDIEIPVPNITNVRPNRKKSHGTPPPTRRELQKAMAEDSEDDEQGTEFKGKT